VIEKDNDAVGQAGIRLGTLQNRGLTYKLATSTIDPDQYHLWAADSGVWTDVHDCLLALLRPGDTFIDAGANIGTVTIPAAVAGVRVIAYECAAENIRFLSAAIAANGVEDRVTVCKAALWDRPGTLPFSGGSAWGRVSDSGAQRVEATTLDDDLPASQIVKVVKLDVEGAELHVMRGMQRLIRTQHPDIVFECNPMVLAGNGSSIVDVFTFLKRFGYRIYRIYLSRRLLSPSGIPQEEAVGDYLATTRNPILLRLQTSHRIGRMRPRHVVRKILKQDASAWPRQVQLLAVADRMPAAVWQVPAAAERLAQAQRDYAGHELLDTFRRGNFGSSEADRGIRIPKR